MSTDIAPAKGYLHFFVRHRWRIALTYLLCIAGALFQLLYPYATGLAIDGALQRDAMALLPLALMWGAHLAVDGFRQVYDTRTFTRIFSEASSDMVAAQKLEGRSTSEVSARVNMMEEFTWFLGSNLPEILIGLVSPIGALVVLFTLEPSIGAAALGLVVAAICFNGVLYRGIKSREVDLNSLTEASVSRIEAGDADGVRDHYQSIGRAFIRISDLNALSWMAVQLFGILVLAFAIWQTGGISQITPGEAYTLVAYVWRALDGAFSVTGFARQLARLTDIWRRINAAA
jgi:hypothetical protein